MAETIYVMCALLSASCAFMLFRQHRAAATQLTFWTGICFAGLALNNALLVIDLVLFAAIDLSLWRTVIAVAAMAGLIFGFIWHSY